MKGKHFRMCLVAALLTVAVSASAALTNTVPYTNSFETSEPAGYTNGMSVVDTNYGWYAEDVENGVVVTQSYTYTGAYPLGQDRTAHTNVLELSDTITNLINSGSHKQIWVDCMVQPRFWDQEGTPEVPTNEVKTAVYFDTNGLINVLGGAFYFAGEDGYTNEWITLSNPALVEGQWVRLTINLTFESSDEFDPNFYFQVQLDAGPPLQHPNGTSAAGGISSPGSWFRCPENVKPFMSSLTLSGTGYFDDLQVVTGTPTDVTLHSVTATVDNALAAWIEPAGTAPVVESNDISFTIGEIVVGSVTNVLIDGTTLIGPTNSYTFTNVTENHSIHVLTDIGVGSTSRGTPYWWILLHYPDTTNFEVADTSDTDGDGHKAYQEWYTGTIPTNSASVFKVLDVIYAGASNLVVFYGSTNVGVDEAWSMYAITNAPSTDLSNWTEVEDNTIPRDPNGTCTNEWWDTAPLGNPIFYLPVAEDP
jgi:hypothetical protein